MGLQVKPRKRKISLAKINPPSHQPRLPIPKARVARVTARANPPKVIPKVVRVVKVVARTPKAEAEVASSRAKVLTLPRTGAPLLLRRLLPTLPDPRKKSLASLRLSNKDLVQQVRIANIATITRS